MVGDKERRGRTGCRADAADERAERWMKGEKRVKYAEEMGEMEDGWRSLGA